MLNMEIRIFWRWNSHSPALASRRGIGEYPPLSAPFRPGSSSPRGEAVNRISPFGRGVHRAAARKHPVTERSEVAVLTSVRGPAEQEVGGRGPHRNERKRVVEAQAGGGWRVSHEKSDFPPQPFKSVMTQATLSVIDRAGRRLSSFAHGGSALGSPVTSYSLRRIAGSGPQ